MFRYAVLLLIVVAGLSHSALGQAKTAAFAPKFYAFQNGLKFGSYAEEAKVLKELGYDGVNQAKVTGQKLAEQVAAYKKVGLHVLSTYLNVTDKPITEEQVKPLANSDAMIELTIRKITPKTVEAVRATAEMAAKLKIRVALYPHAGNGVATMAQAMELIKKVDHANLGVMFNLCHFLKSEKAEDLEGALEKAGARLFAVSTAGADLKGKNWGQLIQTLDKGDFPQARLFATLKKLKFTGPVGLQCYAVRGDKRTNLKNSIAAWSKVLQDL
jgi:sugar phosphate isomerase/epimerase